MIPGFLAGIGCQRKAAPPEIVASDFVEAWMTRVQTGGDRQVEWYTFPYSELHRWKIYEVERPADQGNCVTLRAWVWQTATSHKGHFYVKLFLQDDKTRLFHASLYDSEPSEKEWLKKPEPRLNLPSWTADPLTKGYDSNLY